MNTEPSKQCRTIILEDRPSDSDAFGPHERIADAIEHLVASEKGGKAIALIGSLGSGKSTVIELLKSKLQDNQILFVFNAWSHQGDPLRRSFLENLIQYLLKENWLQNNEYWKEEKEKIARRREDSTTTSSPQLTKWGKAISISILLLPLSYKFIDLFLDNLSHLNTLYIAFGGIGVALLLLPLIIAVLAYYFSPRDDEHSIVSLFINKSVQRNRSITIRTPDPTSIEFQNIFYKILDESINDKERKLIVVIDNLDRADTQEMLLIWSTMRTFFEFENNNINPRWIKHLWLLAPFDSEALRRLWKVGISEYKDSEVKLEQELSESFIDKTFQIKFLVPPPIMSDWKNYFIKKISCALPDHTYDDYLEIYHLYRSLKKKDAAPTPREIILFINQIGAFHRQWSDTIPLKYQALYVIYKKELHTSKKALINPDDKNIQLINRTVSSDFPRHLAALHYNIEPQKALQTLMEEDVVNALKNNDVESLKEYNAVSGFVDVCDNIIEDRLEDWLESDPNTIANSANVFEVLDSETEKDFARIWNRLGRAVNRVNSWNGTDESLGKGLVAILNHCQEDKYKNLPLHVIETISNTDPIEPSENSEDEERDIDSKVVKDWISGALTLLTYYRSANLDEEIDKFRVPGGAQFYVEILSELSKNPAPLDFTDYFKPKSDPQDVIDRLAAISEDPGFSELHANCVDTMTRIDFDWAWTNLIKALKINLENAGNLNPIEIRACVQSLSILAYKKDLAEAKEVLKQLSENGQLFHILNHVISKKDYAAAAACILPIMEFNPGASVSIEVGHSTDGINKFQGICNDPDGNHQIIDKLYSLVRSLNRTQDLINLGDTESPIKPLVRSILEKIALSEDVDQHITPDMIIDNFDTLDTRLSEDALSNLIKVSTTKVNLLAKLTDEDFDKDLAGLYLVSYQETKEQNRGTYLDFLIAGLRSIDTQTWNSELSDPSYRWDLLQALIEDGISLHLNDRFYNALLNNVDILCGDEFKLSSSQLLETLDSASQETFMRNLRDKILHLATTDSSIAPYISFWGDELITKGFLGEKADDVCRHLLTRCLSSNDINEIKWANKALTTNKKLFEDAQSASKTRFKENTKDLLKDSAVEDSIREELIQIAENIGVDIAQIQHSTDEEKGSEEEEEEEEEENEEVDSENESDT